MTGTTHIRTLKKTHYGIIILCTLFVLSQSATRHQSLLETVSGTFGLVAVAVTLYSFYHIFFGKGKITLTASQFKVRGYDWTNWEELISVYPFTEQDMESGDRDYIRFRLRDGTDLSLRSEDLEMSFEEIADLVSLYRINHI
jgi:hypothetical protein